MVDKADSKEEYDRGFVDGSHGTERRPPRQASAWNAFLDGLVGSRSLDVLQAAYEQGYIDGLAVQRGDTQSALAG